MLRGGSIIDENHAVVSMSSYRNDFARQRRDVALARVVEAPRNQRAIPLERKDVVVASGNLDNVGQILRHVELCETKSAP